MMRSSNRIGEQAHVPFHLNQLPRLGAAETLEVVVLAFLIAVVIEVHSAANVTMRATRLELIRAGELVQRAHLVIVKRLPCHVYLILIPAEAPGIRKKLELAPKVVSEVASAVAPIKSSVNPFGNAAPRDQAEIDRRIEERRLEREVNAKAELEEKKKADLEEKKKRFEAEDKKRAATEAEEKKKTAVPEVKRTEARDWKKKDDVAVAAKPKADAPKSKADTGPWRRMGGAPHQPNVAAFSSKEKVNDVEKPRVESYTKKVNDAEKAVKDIHSKKVNDVEKVKDTHPKNAPQNKANDTEKPRKDSQPKKVQVEKPAVKVVNSFELLGDR